MLVSKNQILTKIISISSGPGNSLAVDLNERIFVWGNKKGQRWLIFGRGKKSPYVLYAMEPKFLNAKQTNEITNIIAATIKGQNRIQVLKKDGTVWGWGHNYQGALGSFSCLKSDSPCISGGQKLFVQVHTDTKKPIRDIVAIESGNAGNTNVAIVFDGTAFHWGAIGNIGGRSGYLSGAQMLLHTSSKTPITNIIAASGSYSTPFVLLSSGKVVTVSFPQMFLKKLDNIISVLGTQSWQVFVNAKGNIFAANIDVNLQTQFLGDSNIISLDSSASSNLAAILPNGQVQVGKVSKIGSGLQSTTFL